MKKWWKILFILIIALPIGSSYYPWLDIFNNEYGVTILDVLFSILLFIQILNTKFSLKIKKSQVKNIIIVGAILITFIVALCKGYEVYGLSSLRDSFKYFMCIEFLIYSIILDNDEDDKGVIINLSYIGYIGYTIITLVTSIVFDMSGERIGASSFTLSIILVPFAVHNYINSKNKKMAVTVIVCFVINSVISQNRTAFILAIAATLVEFMFMLKMKISKKIFSRIAAIVTIGVVFFIGMIIENNSLMNRIITGGEINTFAGRVNTFNYYITVMREHLGGLGFGYPMHFFTEGNYKLPAETFQVDNAIIVWGTKGGLIFLFAFMYLMLVPLFKINVQQSIKDKIFAVSYMFLLVGASLMTSQVIQGRSTALFIWSMVGFFLKTTYRKQNV